MKSLFIIITSLGFLYTGCSTDNDLSNISAQDKAFASQAAVSNRTAVIMGNIAVSKATDTAVKSYAARMVASHSAAVASLTTIAANEGIALIADSLDASTVVLRDALKNLSGRSFDSVYIYGQVAAHEKSVGFVQMQVNDGTNGALRDFALSMLPVEQDHLVKADTLATKFK